VPGIATMKQAIEQLFGHLDRHARRIAETRSLVDAAFRFQTPARPVIQFEPAGFAYEASPWADTAHKRLLDHTIQNICFQLEALPESDYVPALHPNWGRSDLIPGMWGVEFDYTPEGAAIQKNRLIHDMADVAALPDVDPAETEQGRAILDTIRFLVEATQGRLQVVYPQMQGPLTNIVRLMPQEEALMAFMTHPDEIRILSEKIWRIAVRLVKSMQEAAGGAHMLRPRMRGYQPEWVKGLIVDDYLSVIRPEDYLALCGSSWQMMADEIGPIFFHTCGPTLQCAEVMQQLPGLIGFETAFIRGVSKTTDELMEMKAALAGKVVLQSFVLPHGETVHDEERLTPEWLWEMNEGGGFLLHGAGTVEQGRRLWRAVHQGKEGKK